MRNTAQNLQGDMAWFSLPCPEAAQQLADDGQFPYMELIPSPGLDVTFSLATQYDLPASSGIADCRLFVLMSNRNYDAVAAKSRNRGFT